VANRIGSKEDLAWQQGFNIDAYVAVPWIGLLYRHEFLLHYSHEVLETHSNESRSTSNNDPMPSRRFARLNCNSKYTEAARSEDTGFGPGNGVGRRKVSVVDDPYWWILAGGIHVPGFEGNVALPDRSDGV
jgi:hypothetical protein